MAEATSPRRPSVLVVEPNRPLREAIKEALSGSFQVLAAQTISGALVGFEHHHPPVVLISMKQAEGNGLELCARLREHAAARSTHIVVYGSGEIELPEDLSEGDLKQRYRFDRYLARGVTLQRLEAVVHDGLNLGWKALSTGSEPPRPKEKVEPSFENPWTTTDVVSARVAEPKQASRLKRFFKR